MIKPNYLATGLAFLLIGAIVATAAVGFVRLPAFAHEGHTDYIKNTEYIKGHLEQAVANKQAGNTELAIAHSGHPIIEVFVLMEGPLAEVSPERAEALKEALEALPNSVQSDTVQAFSQKVAEITGMLDEAVEVFAGEEAEELSTKAGVIKGLLETAGIEYAEAVDNGEIIEMIEYQDASAFISRANATFATIQSEMDDHEAEEIVEFFGQLYSSIEAKADPEDIQTLLDGIVHELEEVFGLEEQDSDYDGYAYIDKIIELLDEAVIEYQAGNSREAEALTIEAYLDNYEFIEADIAQDDRELMEKIEIDMRVELVQMIQDGRPAADIQSHVDQIKTDLEVARAVVTPEFPLVAVAIVAGMMALAVIATRLRGSAIFRNSPI